MCIAKKRIFKPLMQKSKKAMPVLLSLILIAITFVSESGGAYAETIDIVGLNYAGSTVTETVKGNDYFYEAKASGYFQFELYGGAQYGSGLTLTGNGTFECIGGCVKGTIWINKGEKVLIKEHPGAGGNNNAVLDGKSALGLYIGDKLIAGAGGASGFSYYRNSDSAYSLKGSKNAKTDIYGDGIFGGGGSSDYRSKSNEYTYGADSPDGVPANDSGQNYIDTDRVTDWTSGLAPRPQLNQYTDAKFTLINVGIDVYEVYERVEQLQASIGAITLDDKLPAPVITVCKNEPFDVRINQYDDAITGTSDGITLENDVIGDGYIKIQGKISDKIGYYDAVINGKLFTFNIIAPPDASNVYCVLD